MSNDKEMPLTGNGVGQMGSGPRDTHPPAGRIALDTAPIASGNDMPGRVGAKLEKDDRVAGAGERFFRYHGCQFLLRVELAAKDVYQSHVFYQHGIAGMEAIALPQDADPYASPDEAWRHAEQQAVRWVHDRTGDGQGRF